TVEEADEELAVGIGGTPAVNIAAPVGVDVCRDLGIMPPAQLAGPAVDRKDVLRAEGGRHVEGVADDQGRRLLSPKRPELQDPRGLQLLHVRRADLLELAPMGVAGIASVVSPVNVLSIGQV